MKHLKELITASTAAFFMGCTATPAKPLTDPQIDELANLRCLFQTNVFNREAVTAMGQMQLDKAPDDQWREHWKGVAHAQHYGLSDADYKRLTNAWPLKDCHKAVIPYLMTSFPQDTVVKFTMVLGQEGFFKGNQLSAPLNELCEGKYKAICS